MGQDGVAAGPEARAAAGQWPQRPLRLSTGFFQGKWCEGWRISGETQIWKQMLRRQQAVFWPSPMGYIYYWNEWKKHILGDFPGGTVVKNVPANAGNMASSPGLGRSHMPWSNKAPAPQLLSLCSRAHKPQLLKPPAPRARAPQQEKPPQWEACAPQPRIAPTCCN